MADVQQHGTPRTPPHVTQRKRRVLFSPNKWGPYTIFLSALLLAMCVAMGILVYNGTFDGKMSTSSLATQEKSQKADDKNGSPKSDAKDKKAGAPKDKKVGHLPPPPTGAGTTGHLPPLPPVAGSIPKLSKKDKDRKPKSIKRSKDHRDNNDDCDDGQDGLDGGDSSDCSGSRSTSPSSSHSLSPSTSPSSSHCVDTVTTIPPPSSTCCGMPGFPCIVNSPNNTICAPDVNATSGSASSVVYCQYCANSTFPIPDGPCCPGLMEDDDCGKYTDASSRNIECTCKAPTVTPGVNFSKCACKVNSGFAPIGNGRGL
eukprot:gb/GEZN01011516.1/.p1 GENE.gb/GEZN01011516.1/~~gb/GEZN01011516.1/.p1  ORF type:complete len:314 (+),score=35.06 gb/GEZN01011516.1/:33-974(+)